MTRTIRRVLVLTGDHGLPDETKRGARYNVEDMATHAAMRAAFESLGGYDFSFLSDHAVFVERIRTDPPDLVVNFCDTGFRNVATQELHIPAFLEMHGVPCTGAPPAAMVLCFDKAVVRQAAAALGVPVPAEAFVAADAPPGEVPEFRYPALVKPNTADGSVGITRDAVVQDRDEAAEYLAFLRRTLPGRDALIQEYLPGPEYGQGLIGNPGAFTVLPPLEVDFSALPEGLAPILSHESKALPDSPYWTDIRFRRAALDEAAAGRIAGWSQALFRRLGLRDYGRFDFRAAADGEPRLMEVNPNPAWANDGKLAFMAGFAGIEYPRMLGLILEAAVRRLGGRD